MRVRNNILLQSVRAALGVLSMDERRRKRPRVEAHTILPGVKFECDLYKEDYNTVLGFMLVSHTLLKAE